MLMGWTRSSLVAPLTAKSGDLLQLTGQARGVLLFLQMYCLPLGVLCGRMRLVFFASVCSQAAEWFVHAESIDVSSYVQLWTAGLGAG